MIRCARQEGRLCCDVERRQGRGGAEVESRCGLVLDDAKDLVSSEFLAAIEEREFDQEGEANDVGLKFFEEASDSGGSTACCEEVVDDEDAFVGLDIFGVDLDGVEAVFEFVAFFEGFVG